MTEPAMQVTNNVNNQVTNNVVTNNNFGPPQATPGTTREIHYVIPIY